MWSGLLVVVAQIVGVQKEIRSSADADDLIGQLSVEWGRVTLTAGVTHGSNVRAEP